MTALTFTPRDRVLAARELAQDAVEAGHVAVGVGFLAALADDLLTLPIPELLALRAELAPTVEEPIA